MRARGGSGGPIIEIVISRPDGRAPFVLQTQGIGLALVASSTDWPAFEVWSNAGGGTYTRLVYTWRPREQRYCSDRVDEFEDHGDDAASVNVVRLVAKERFVRLARSRSFGCRQESVVIASDADDPPASWPVPAVNLRRFARRMPHAPQWTGAFSERMASAPHPTR